MNQLEMYLSECQIDLDLSELEYLTVIPKDLQHMISEHFRKDVILCRFLNHLINSYLVGVSYSPEFLNVPLFEEKIIELLRNEFGDPFDFSEYENILREKFLKLFGMDEITDDLIEKYYKGYDITELFDGKLGILYSEIMDLFNPQLGKDLNWDQDKFWDIYADLIVFVVDNIRSG